MIKITFVDINGVSRVVEAVDGQSLMDVAVENLIPGIDGDCGGCLACGTCHVMLNPEWLGKVPAIEDAEGALLEFVDLRTASSRLACQVKASRELDGIVVNTPLGQH